MTGKFPYCKKNTPATFPPIWKKGLGVPADGPGGSRCQHYQYRGRGNDNPGLIHF